MASTSLHGGPDFRRLFEKSPARCIVLSADLIIVAVTDSYLRATKKARSIVGRPIFDVFPDNPEDPEATGAGRVRAHFERILATRAAHTMPVQRYDIERLASEGGGFEERHWQLAGEPVLGDDDEVQFILHYVEDVTELVEAHRLREVDRRKFGDLQAQASAMELELFDRARTLQTINSRLHDALGELDQARAAAEMERANLRSFIMQAPAMLCMLRGPDHVYDIANSTYTQLVGGRDIVGKTIRQARPELAGQGFYELLDQVYATGEAYVGREVSAEVYSPSGNIERRFLNFVYLPTRGADGKTNGIAVYASDVTEFIHARHQLEKLLDVETRARAEAERMVHFSEMFVGMLGHDLRNPLSATITAAQHLLRRTDDERLKKPAMRIASSSERMSRMIDQLLDFTRVRIGGGFVLQRKTLDLEELSRRVAEEVSDGAVTKASLVYLVSGDVTGSFDEDRLAQVLSNLIGNAVQHGLLGTPITLRVDGTGRDVVTLAVHNQGAIPEELRANLFDPFRQGAPHKRRNQNGLGLGLYISQQITIAHGGTLDVDSAEERGTEFTMRLSRHPSEPPPENDTSSSNDRSRGA